MCWDSFKKKKSLPRDEEEEGEESTKTRTSKTRKKKKKKKESTTEEDEETESTAASKLRKHHNYDQFFENQLQLDQHFSERLSTIANDRVVNVIQLPLLLQHNRKEREIRTPQEFATTMGYSVVRRLGAGAYGDVFLVDKHIPGKNKVSKYRMACKVMNLVDSKEPRALRHLDNLRSELYVLQSFRGKCPYVIEYIEHYVLRFCKGSEMVLQASIYMEFADGGTLNDVVKKKSMEPKLLRRYFAEMTAGLEFLHRNQVAHNDFKLDNVLLVTDVDQPKVKHCKLTDFGMAQYAWKDGVGIIYSTKHWGTLTYMAPEVLQNGLIHGDPTKYVPFKADVFSLGVALYIMTTRSYPFDTPKDSTDEEYKKVIQEMKQGVFSSKQLRKRVPKQWRTNKLISLMQGMLEYDPKTRFTVDMVAKHAWLKNK